MVYMVYVNIYRYDQRTAQKLSGVRFSSCGVRFFGDVHRRPSL
jgi:hypothetical protein